MTGVGSASGDSGADAPPGWRRVIVAPLLRSRARPWWRSARTGRAEPTGPTGPTESPGPTRPAGPLAPAGLAARARPVEPAGPIEEMPQARLELRPAGEAGVYLLVGEADIAARERLRAGLAAAADGAGDLRLDLAGLTFIDVGCTAELVGTALRLGGGRRLILDNAAPMLCRIIDLAWGRLPALEVNPR